MLFLDLLKFTQSSVRFFLHLIYHAKQLTVVAVFRIPVPVVPVLSFVKNTTRDVSVLLCHGNV